MIDRAEALKMIALTPFEPMSPELIRDAYAGVENDEAFLGNYQNWIIIIDGNKVQFEDPETGEWFQFLLKEI